MANFNKVILAGNLTRDPQLSYTPSNTAVCEFGLAVNRTWRSQDGQKREDTCFVDCTCFGKQAEVFNQYMSKGRPVMLEGRLKFDSWENKEGQRRNKLSVVVENFQFLGGAERGGGAGGERSGGGERSDYGNRGGGQRGGARRTMPEDDGPAPVADYDDGPSVGGDDVPF